MGASAKSAASGSTKKKAQAERKATAAKQSRSRDDLGTTGATPKVLPRAQQQKHSSCTTMLDCLMACLCGCLAAKAVGPNPSPTSSYGRWPREAGAGGPCTLSTHTKTWHTYHFRRPPYSLSSSALLGGTLSPWPDSREFHSPVLPIRRSSNAPHARARAR